MSDTKPRTMSDLIKSKKDLIKKRKNDPALDLAINAQLEQIESMIWSRVNKSDQNLFRVFYKTAKEMLEPGVFNQLEGVAGTRQHFHQSGHQTGNK